VTFTQENMMTKKKGHIEIPTPSIIPRGKGINGTAYGNDTSIRTRLPKHERKSVEAAADALGLTPSNFIRWCAVQVASVINHK